jgi:hypothetical protein
MCLAEEANFSVSEFRRHGFWGMSLRFTFRIRFEVNPFPQLIERDQLCYAVTVVTL